MYAGWKHLSLLFEMDVGMSSGGGQSSGRRNRRLMQSFALTTNGFGSLDVEVEGAVFVGLD